MKERGESSRKGRRSDDERFGSVKDPRLQEAPALDGRAPEGKVAQQADCLKALPFFRTLMDSFPGMVVVLNRYCQIVYANQAFLGELGVPIGDILGMRPGEALRCVHSGEAPGGCGASPSCRGCGAMETILQSLAGREWSEECRVLCRREDRLEPLNIRVQGKPFTWEGEPFTIFSLQDITEEIHRKVLDRIFFHDLLNLAAGIQAWASILEGEKELERKEVQEVGRNLLLASRELVREIRAQKALSLAERGELVISLEKLRSRALLERTLAQVGKLDLARDKELVLAPGAEDREFLSDPVLVGRILLNLVRNALEAEPRGSRVTLDCRGDEEGLRFLVHNPGVIPQEVQAQLFQRSFSTKGPGRGLGTYSVRLFAERYLGGKVSFRSNALEGTLFQVFLPWTGPSLGKVGAGSGCTDPDERG